jgi:hypothetical protein
MFSIVVALLLIGCGIWSYVNWSLGVSYAIPLFLTLVMIVIWLVLYFGGRLDTKTRLPQTHKLHHFMRDTLSVSGIHEEG